MMATLYRILFRIKTQLQRQHFSFRFAFALCAFSMENGTDKDSITLKTTYRFVSFSHMEISIDNGKRDDTAHDSCLARSNEDTRVFFFVTWCARVCDRMRVSIPNIVHWKISRKRKRTAVQWKPVCSLRLKIEYIFFLFVFFAFCILLHWNQSHQCLTHSILLYPVLFVYFISLRTDFIERLSWKKKKTSKKCFFFSRRLLFCC